MTKVFMHIGSCEIFMYKKGTRVGYIEFNRNKVKAGYIQSFKEFLSESILIGEF